MVSSRDISKEKLIKIVKIKGSFPHGRDKKLMKLSTRLEIKKQMKMLIEKVRRSLTIRSNNSPSRVSTC